MIRPERPTFRALLLGFLVLGGYYCIHKRVVIDATYNTQAISVSAAVPRSTNDGTSVTPTLAQPKKERYIVDTPGCKIPNFDPFDESVRKYYKKVGRYSCKGKPSFIRLVNGTTPVIDEPSLLTTFKCKPKDVRCTYIEIYRNESVRVPDDAFFFKPEIQLNFGEPLKAEFVHVQCYRGALFHEEYLLLPLLKKDVEERCEQVRHEAGDKGSGLNVLVLGLDSVSRLNFNRHLKETGNYVRDVLRGYELMGYNKVGLNSYPNQTPLLTGLSGNEARNATGGKFFDALDFLWKRYAKKGYRTVFHEEQPKYGLYSYVGDGLRHAPTDYYTRHAVMAIDKSKLKKNSYCLGPRPPLELYLDYMLSLLEVLDKRPFFAYFWMSELAHDHLNMAGHCDAPLRSALGRLYDSGILNSTVLAFMSDHGLRFGSLRQTYIGRFEDSLPYAFLVFPPWFLQQNPRFATALKLNQRRLATHFDMHATLLQLLESGMPRTVTRHGQSLLHELPVTRTCADASVPAQFCACVETEAFAVNHPLSLKVAHFVVASVNTLVGQQLNGKCAPWALKSVLAIRFYPRGVVAKVGNTTDSDYWVKLSVAPGDALFEAVVRHSVDWKTSTFSLVQQADRLDWYSSHSHCARGSRWEKYCYCK
ncbi:uncharacterized protein [Dermacentor albipictus]|uniref:uncharacterized protein n=1 Tax=Dermacentor albipictus TaxID=60249 RepID=UPI0038FCB41F